MKSIYVFENLESHQKYQPIINFLKTQIDEYVSNLSELYELFDLPNAVLWTEAELATNYLSNKPIAAYTNDYFITMTPDVNYWRETYLSITNDCDLDIVQDYYQSVDETDVLQVLGHEIGHHSDLFLDDFDDYGTEIWFEEGMVEYLSKRHLFTEEKFQKNIIVERTLVNYYLEKYGDKTIEAFGSETYELSLQEIFYNYWRAFITIVDLVEEYTSVENVFKHYHAWNHSDKKETLAKWFKLE